MNCKLSEFTGLILTLCVTISVISCSSYNSMESQSISTQHSLPPSNFSGRYIDTVVMVKPLCIITNTDNYLVDSARLIRPIDFENMSQFLKQQPVYILVHNPTFITNPSNYDARIKCPELEMKLQFDKTEYKIYSIQNVNIFAIYLTNIAYYNHICSRSTDYPKPIVSLSPLNNYVRIALPL